MRRLPIYFLIDISESMVGEQIQQVEEGMATIIQTLKSDPYAIETVWISIIVFAGQAKTIVPLQEIVSFYPPKFPISSGTSLGNGLGHLMFELRRNVVTTTYERKGDWKPIVFLFTDGVPTDDAKPAIAEWKKNWGKTANMIAISFGDEANTQILGELTENVLLFKNTNAGSYKQFFKWITDSIKTSSESVEKNTTGFELAELDDTIVTKVDLTKTAPPSQYLDNNFVVLAGKCQNTKRPYLIKYKKFINSSAYAGLNYQTMAYRLVGGYQVDNNYYELSDGNDHNFRINSSELVGAPTCPSCGNQHGIAVCVCGQIHCVGSEPVSTCPTCHTQGTYGYGSEGFDINRAQG
ncbi:TerY-C metal binding domain-containing protein [Emticicia sp. 17c]|uniref:TerY-C metal binding domain-containing protein n=1 Tax=Emticicia sp. 17c TaxID=3127704 RepID=UPI00301DF4F6